MRNPMPLHKVRAKTTIMSLMNVKYQTKAILAKLEDEQC